MNIERILLTTIFAGVCLALLTPFVIAPVLYPYIFSKVIFFQIIIELLIPIWIILTLINPKYRPRFNFLTISLLVFFGVLFLSALLGIDFDKSFWGYDSRMNGIFTLLHFLGFYFILLSLFKKEVYKKRIFLFTLGVSSILSIAAILEHFCSPFREFISGNERVFSSLGNPIFFAAYLLPHIFIALYLIFLHRRRGGTSKNKLARAAFLFIAVLNIFAVYFTFTRGAFVGLAAGILVMILIWVIKKRVGLILALIFILMLGSSFFAENILSFLGAEPTGTIATRLIIWDIAKEGFKAHPILGWGPENFDIIFDKYYNPKSLDYSYYETWGDRAHNLSLEILATSGILGLASYLLIFGAIFRAILKRQNRYGGAVLAGAFVAYFAQNLFAFDSPCALLIFFLLMAYISKNDVHEEYPKIKNKPLIILIFIPFIVSIIFLNIRPALANNYALKSIDAFLLDYRASEQYFKRSMSIWSPYYDMARIKFANAVYTSEDANELEKKQLILFAIDEVEKSAFNHPKDFSYPLTLGNLYASIGEYSSAYNEYNKALELSPKRQIIYFQFASAKFLAGEDDEARIILQQAVELDITVREPHWRLGLGMLGVDDKTASEEAKKAIELGYHTLNMEEINAFASVFIRESDWEGLVSYYKLLVKSNKGLAGVYNSLRIGYLETGQRDMCVDCVAYAEIYAQLAAAYLETGQKEKARDMAIMAADLDPNLKESTELFIKSLK